MLLKRSRASSLVSYSDSGAGWGNLPLDVAFLVLNKFSEFIDIVRFRMVCEEWGRLAKLYSQSTKLCRKFPMLVIPKRNRKKGGRKHKGVLHRLSEEQAGVQCINFPRTKIDGSRRYCFGCCHGWLAIIDVVLVEESRKRKRFYLPNEYESIITLFNPFTNTELPSLPPLQNNDIRLKVVLSDRPTLNPNDYVVVAFYTYLWNQLYIIKAGQNWQRIIVDLRPDPCFSDVIFYQGQFYAADPWGQMVSFDLNGKLEQYSIATQSRRTFSTGPAEWEYDTVPHTEQAYLAETIDGDLLYVRRYVLKARSVSFEVYKLLFNGSIVEYVEVNNIGNEALFVGNNQTVSVLASSVRGCQPNCIYFTDGYTKSEDDLNDEFQGNTIFKYYQECDMGISNLADRAIQQNYWRHTFAKPVPPPFWIIPQFKL